jgi:hypothetical protein
LEDFQIEKIDITKLKDLNRKKIASTFYKDITSVAVIKVRQTLITNILTKIEISSLTRVLCLVTI